VRTDTPGESSRPVSRGRWLAIAIPAAFLVAITITVGVVTRPNAPRGVSVEGDAIRIDRERGEPVVIPLALVRGIEIVPADRAGGAQRVSGYAGGDGRAYGHFRSSALGDFQLYASRRGPWVLLATARGPVVLTPDAPDELVAAVRSRLGRTP
jgi:hypothetical protein